MKPLFARLALATVVLAVLGFTACRGGSECGDGPTASPCPSPPDGFALVEGVVTRADGAPVRGVEVQVGCPFPPSPWSPQSVRLGDSRNSDRDGRYRVGLALDTTGGRWVGWGPAGMFVTSCGVVAEKSQSGPDTAAVTFFREREDVISTRVDLQMQ